MNLATASCSVALIVLAIASCGTGPGRNGMSVRDSAGITLVEHGPDLPEGLERWSLDSTPILDIGKAEGDESYLFTRIVHAGTLPRGELLVADRATSELRIFESTGVFSRKFGRNGSGPGEFRDLSWVGVDRSGFITTYDLALRRLSRFAGDGTLQQEISLQSSPGAPIGSVLGRFDDGSTLMRSFLNPPTDHTQLPSGLVRDSILLSLIAPDGGSGIPVGRLPGTQHVRAVGPRLFAQDPAPFGLRTSIVPADTVFYVSLQETYEIRVYSREGRLQRVIRRRVPPQPVGAAAKAEWKQQWDKRLAGFKGAAPPQITELARYHSFPEVFPFHGDLLVDRVGNLWVEDYRPFPGKDPVTTWIVFSPKGTILATAEFPNVQITEIDAGKVVGVWRGEDDVPHVRAYRVTKGTRRPMED